MVKAVVDGVRIAGIQAAVPGRRHSFTEDNGPFTAEEAAKLHAGTGVLARRIAPPHICASDLCLAAAEALIAQLDWDPKTIGLLIFVTQDPDYVIPATACLMQRRLGLSVGCAAFDVNLGCSGYVYGLWTAAQLLRGTDAGRALVLAGDINTRTLKPGDRATLPLFGDAGSATALEADPAAAPLHAVLGTDGSGGRHLLIRAGGARHTLLPPGLPRPAEEESRLFDDARLHLNGAEVFGFALRTVPGLLREAMAHAGRTAAEVDWFVMHQANRFMLEHLRKKAGLPAERFVIDMEEYGNTSSASIPLAMCSALGEDLARRSARVLCAGFGVGWSWGAMVAEVGPLPLPRVVEMPDDFPPLGLP